MPFLKIEFTQTSARSLSPDEMTIMPSSDEVPIFFISELGDGLDLIPLITEIHEKMGGKNPIYLYCHPSLRQTKQNLPDSFEELAESIAEELEKQLITYAYFHPCIIVSTSITSSLALLITRYLEAQNRETFLCTLEGATPELFKNYFLTQHVTGTLDIIKTIEKAAHRTSLAIPHISDSQLEKLSHIPLIQRITDIANIFIQYQQPNPNLMKITYFQKLIEIVKNYINLLDQYQFSPNVSQSQLNMCTILSQETINKFNHPTCGWDEYAQAGIDYLRIYDKKLDFLDQDKKLVAEQIVNYINSKVNEAYLLAKMWKDVAIDIDDYEKKHQSVSNLGKIKQALLNVTAEKISNLQLISSPSVSKDSEDFTLSTIHHSSKDAKEKTQRDTTSLIDGNDTYFFRRYNTFPRFNRLHCIDSCENQSEIKPPNIKHG